MSLRIGIVCPYSFDMPGGVQFHVRDLAEALPPAANRAASSAQMATCSRARRTARWMSKSRRRAW